MSVGWGVRPKELGERRAGRGSKLDGAGSRDALRPQTELFCGSC